MLLPLFMIALDFIAETWVVEENEGVIGFISLLGNKMDAIFVYPQHRSKGFGRELMNQAKERRNELAPFVLSLYMFDGGIYL